MQSLSPRVRHTIAAALESAWITASGIAASYLLVFFGAYISGSWHSVGDALTYVRATFNTWLVANVVIPSIRGFIAHSKFPTIDTADKPAMVPPAMDAR